MVFAAATRVALVVLLGGGIVACETMTYDTGGGPVDARGRSVEEIDDRNPGDLDFETENPALAIEEEAYEDAVEGAER